MRPSGPGAVGSSAWRELEQLAVTHRTTHLRDLFAADPDRFAKFSAEYDGLLLDYSRQRVDDKVLAGLLELVRTVDLTSWIEQLMSGKPVNNTEQRPALHTALRDPDGDPVFENDCDVKPAIRDVLATMRALIDKLHSGRLQGASKMPIRHVVNIGIGGSDLGVRMTITALAAYHVKNVDVHFVTNVDGSELSDLRAKLDPAEVLFVVCSKSFSTPETMANARAAREWLFDKSGKRDAVQNNFVGISANGAAMSDFGIAPGMQLPVWDWIGGRYSIWSTAGFSLACAIGMDEFEAMLGGGCDMDVHFQSKPFENNLPVLLGLLGVWNINFLNAGFHAVLPYDNRMREFPRFLQQLEMESNGKSVDRNGKLVDYQTAAAVFGEPGNNAQHSFNQMLHQGTGRFSVDLIAPMEASPELAPNHDMGLANCLAQATALMRGVTAEELGETGCRHDLIPHNMIPGNRPSSLIVFPQLDPYNLGRLIALYEHKVFVQSVIWGINPFDQWGVELGKRLANQVLQTLAAAGKQNDPDPSLRGILDYIARQRQ